jgi:hypothetical protein
MHPRWLRYSFFKYGPIFSVVAPCHRGASPVSVRRRDFHHGLLARFAEFAPVSPPLVDATRLGIRLTKYC